MHLDTLQSYSAKIPPVWELLQSCNVMEQSDSNQYFMDMFLEYFNNFLTYEYFAEYFGLDIDGTYLCIKNPFKLGIDIRWAKVILDSEIARLKLTTVDNFGVVGGLYIS